MAQSSFALMTNLGRAKEAAALANGTPLVITHIAIGDGLTVPSGGETALYNEIARKTISGHGTVVGASNVAFFDAFLAAEEGPYTIREAGLFDNAGDLIAIARYDPPINKPVPASGQTVEGTIRLEVAFSNVANVNIVIDPAMQVALQRLSLLPWIPIVSMTTTAPPASPAVGDTYLIPASPTGAWAGHAGKIAEFTTAGWAMIVPKNGHGVSLPDGRVFMRRSNAYTEFAATQDGRGLVELATNAEVSSGSDTQRAVTPAGLASRTATAERTGIVELATSAETIAGTDEARAVTPAALGSLTATTTRRGLVELATSAETVTGSDAERAVTPAGLNARTATETRRGIVELATTAEFIEGADPERAITPAAFAQGISSYLGGPITTLYVRTDGNDNNNGSANDAANAFQTLQGAVNYVMSRFGAGKAVSLFLGMPGLYETPTSLPELCNLRIEGPSLALAPNYRITNAGGGPRGVLGVSSGIVTLRCLTLENAHTGAHTVNSTGGQIDLEDVRFRGGGGNPASFIRAASGGAVRCRGTISFGDPASTVFFAFQGGVITTQNGTVFSFLGNYVYSIAVARASALSLISLEGGSFSGNATGQRYSSNANSVVDTGGGGANFIPGTVAGTVTNGGVYV